MSESVFHQCQFQRVLVMYARLTLLREQPKGLMMNEGTTTMLSKKVEIANVLSIIFAGSANSC